MVLVTSLRRAAVAALGMTRHRDERDAARGVEMGDGDTNVTWCCSTFFCSSAWHHDHARSAPHPRGLRALRNAEHIARLSWLQLISASALRAMSTGTWAVWHTCSGTLPRGRPRWEPLCSQHDQTGSAGLCRRQQLSLR
jgi:hypothetical protein